MPQPGEVWSPGMINLFPLAFPSASSTNAMLPPGSNNSLELLNACSSAPDSWIVSWMSALGRKRTSHQIHKFKLSATFLSEF